MASGSVPNCLHRLTQSAIAHTCTRLYMSPGLAGRQLHLVYSASLAHRRFCAPAGKQFASRCVATLQALQPDASITHAAGTSNSCTAATSVGVAPAPAPPSAAQRQQTAREVLSLIAGRPLHNPSRVSLRGRTRQQHCTHQWQLFCGCASGAGKAFSHADVHWLAYSCVQTDRAVICRSPGIVSLQLGYAGACTATQHVQAWTHTNPATGLAHTANPSPNTWTLCSHSSPYSEDSHGARCRTLQR